jgi:hypothetical protein
LGGVGVGAWPQFSGVCRRSQNGRADAPAGYKIRGAGGDALGFSPRVVVAHVAIQTFGY